MPAKKISLKPLLVPVFLIAMIWMGATILQQFSRPDTQTTQSTPVPEARPSNSTASSSNIANAAASNATTNNPYRVADIDATEDAVVNRWLRGDKAKQFKELWIKHEYRLNQFWEMNFPRNWSYRTYHPPADIRLFDKYAVPPTDCVGRTDDLLEIASYCPTERTIHANAGVMAIEFSNRHTAISVLSLAHEWG